MLESWARQRILHYGSQQVFWKDSSKVISKIFAVFAQEFSNETASSLNGWTLVAYPVHAILFNFSNAYGRWLVLSKHSLVAFLPVWGTAEQQGGSKELTGMGQFFYRHSSSAVVGVQDMIPVTFSTDGRKLNAKVLHIVLSMILSEMEGICPQRFFGRIECNLLVNRFPIPATCCCDVPEENHNSRIQQEISVRRPCIRCMSAMADFRTIRFEEARSILDTLEVQKCCSKLAQVGSICHGKSVYVRTSLGKKNANDHLRYLSLSQNTSFLENLLLATTSIPGKVHNIFGFELL